VGGFEAFELKYQSMQEAGYPVLWLGAASEDEVTWIYQHAWATVYPSLVEGYGLPIVESVARGTPCVTSVLSATGEVATQVGGCLVIDPRDSEALRATLVRILSEPGLREQLSADIRLDALGTWHTYAEEIHAVVKSLMALPVG
jgi:glycosyltransferase involved in cell wall biosynthesis